MIDIVDEADMDVWRAIDHGERPIDWEAWFGHRDGADYLTDVGKGGGGAREFARSDVRMVTCRGQAHCRYRRGRRHGRPRSRGPGVPPS